MIKMRVTSQSLQLLETKRRIREIRNKKNKLKRKMMKTILFKNKKKMIKLIRHLRRKRLYNRANRRKRNRVRLKKIGKTLILIHSQINSKEKMAPVQSRKSMKKTMKIFSDNKFKMKKISVRKIKARKLMEVNKKVVMTRKQRKKEEIFLTLKCLIKKRQRELRKERRNYLQGKRRERQNQLKRRENSR